MTTPPKANADKGRRRRRSRRSLLGAVGGLVAAGVGAAAYARWVEPTWIDIVQRDLPVPDLPQAWEGVRVGLIADLHHSAGVPLAYLAEGVGLLAALEPDVVAVAGDFVTNRSRRYTQAVAGLFREMKPPLGVFACLGNHDYGVVRAVAGAKASAVVDALPRAGVRVLQNEAVRLVRDGQDLWIAGTEDLWSGRLDAAKTMRAVPKDAANIVLCHNPDGADALAAAGAGAILAGHTHGGQVQVPLLGPPILPVTRKDRYEGLHRVGRSWLYVNRGLGWLVKVRFCCRPEITVLSLCGEPAPVAVSA